VKANPPNNQVCQAAPRYHWATIPSGNFIAFTIPRSQDEKQVAEREKNHLLTLLQGTLG
jgi:hypothetical protein